MDFSLYLCVMKNLLYILIIILFLSSCKVTEKLVEVPIETIKTEYIYDKTIDSIYIKDSVDRYISGDTVYQYKYKYIYKYLYKTDTLVKNDTIEKPVEIVNTEIKEVNKIKWYQSILMWIGGISLLIGAFKIGKKFKL